MRTPSPNPSSAPKVEGAVRPTPTAPAWPSVPRASWSHASWLLVAGITPQVLPGGLTNQPFHGAVDGSCRLFRIGGHRLTAPWLDMHHIALAIGQPLTPSQQNHGTGNMSQPSAE